MTVSLPIAARAVPFDFRRSLRDAGRDALVRAPVTTLQINVGKRCNQACHHCHVEAGPKRTEEMDGRTAARLLELIDATETIETVDITGGAPELNANFRTLVSESRARGLRVIDRCNLTILFEPGQQDLAEFLAENQVNVTASLPCYSRANVESQRGKGVFAKSIAALRRLNELGYGAHGSGLSLDLVYNPGGAYLPPPQASLQADYKQRLKQDHGVEFNQLFTITNMPIARFAHQLEREGRHDEYMSLLVTHFNSDTIDALMCRHLVSVGYDGALYDCDFNQMLDIAVPVEDGIARTTVWDVDTFSDFEGLAVATGEHCYGCTAGAGSSCGGALD